LWKRVAFIGSGGSLLKERETVAFVRMEIAYTKVKTAKL